MVSLSSAQPIAALRQEITPLTSHQKKSSWLPGFWPFSSSQGAVSPSLKERIQTTITSKANAAVGAIRSAWDRNISPKPNLGDHLNDVRKKIAQHQVPRKTIEPSDWRAETNRQMDESIRIFSLSQTLEWMHPKLAETDPNTAAQIIREASKTNRSLCDSYLEKKGHELSLLSVLIVKLTYFFLYECGIIPNIVEYSSKAILEHIRLGLIQKDGGKNLTTLTRIILKRLNSVLSDYLKAVTDYGNGKGTGSKEDYVKEQLKKELDVICREFGNLIVTDFLPDHISFFHSWKESPYLSVRLLAKIFTYYPEIWLTSFVHAQLRNKIPNQIQSLIQAKTEQDDERRDLSFSIAITNSIIEQLGKFEQNLHNHEISSASKSHAAGTEQLPVVITLLLEILRLESCEDRAKIKEQLNKTSSISSPITKELEESLIKGCHTFFSYLSDPNHSEEFIYNLLVQATTSFTSDAPSTNEEWANQAKDYVQLQEAMREKAGEIFQDITRKSIVQYARGLSDAAQESLAQEFCKRERDRWNKTVDQFQSTVGGMQKKVQEIPLTPNLTPLPALDKSIFGNLDVLVKQISSCRSSIISSLEKISDLPDSIKKGIKEALEPLVLQLDALLDSKSMAKELQERLENASIVAKALRSLKSSLAEHTSIEKLEEFSKLWPLSEKALEELKTVKKDTALAADYLKQLQESHRQLHTETLITRNLASLGKAKGLLNQFGIAIETNLREPSFIFSARKLRAQIVILCQSLPASEREQILSIVDAMRNAQSIAQLREERNTLEVKMQAIYDSHIAEKQSALKTLQQTLQSIEFWTQEELRDAEAVAITSKQALGDVLGKMEQEIFPKLREEIEKILPNRIESYRDQGKRILKNHTSNVGGVLGLAVGGALSYGVTYAAQSLWESEALVGAWALPVAATIAGAVRYMMINPDEPSSTKPKPEASATNKKAADIQGQVITSMLSRAGAGMVLGGAAAYWLPFYAQMATPLVLGYAGKNAPQVEIGIADKIVYPQVQEVFDNLYKFILQPHVWNLLVVEAIEAINVANRKT